MNTNAHLRDSGEAAVEMQNRVESGAGRLAPVLRREGRETGFGVWGEAVSATVDGGASIITQQITAQQLRAAL